MSWKFGKRKAAAEKLLTPIKAYPETAYCQEPPPDLKGSE